RAGRSLRRPRSPGWLACSRCAGRKRPRPEPSGTAGARRPELLPDVVQVKRKLPCCPRSTMDGHLQIRGRLLLRLPFLALLAAPLHGALESLVQLGKAGAGHGILPQLVVPP